MDGRHVHVRSAHAALNTLLQSAGALVCKKWLVTIDERLQAAGYKHGWDGDYCFCAFSHDECQVAMKPELVDFYTSILQPSMTDVEQWAKFRCPLACEFKIGTNWSETH